MPDIDHHAMNPPFLRVAEQRLTPSGDIVYQWDLRVGQPNVAAMTVPVIHSLEHFLGAWMRDRSKSVVTVAPMGCQTGFYITAIGIAHFDDMAELVAEVLVDITKAVEVPLADPSSCGQAQCHSLIGAQHVAKWLLSRQNEWGTISL